MERVFAITSSSKTVALDSQGRGKVTFTVTNTGSEPLTARCRIEAEEPAAASWFESLERPERRLEPEATEQLTVNLAVPAGSPAGNYSFRLDATSVENPDEHHVQGQSVAFEVAPPPPEKKAGFPWWILIVLGVLAAGALAWLLWPQGAPGLGEVCDGDCAAGLVCEGEGEGGKRTCIGTVGFAGCASGSDCAQGLECYEVEEGGEMASLCLGTLDFAGCREANDCGPDLVCGDDEVCRGGPGFACSSPSGCAAGLLCWGGTCKADTTGANCDSGNDCAPGQTCVAVVGGKKCLRSVGQSCANDFQCSTLKCAGGQCVKLDNGEQCSQGVQCRSNLCLDNRCASCTSAQQCGGRAWRCVSGTCSLNLDVIGTVGTVFELDRSVIKQLEMQQQQQLELTDRWTIQTEKKKETRGQLRKKPN